MRRLLKFLINDLKEDFKILKLLLTGKYDGERFQKNMKKAMNLWPQILKTFWIFYIIIILAFFVGWSLSAKYYHAKCVNIINTEIIPQANGFVQKEQQKLGHGLNISVSLVEGGG